MCSGLLVGSIWNVTCCHPGLLDLERDLPSSNRASTFQSGINFGQPYQNGDDVHTYDPTNATAQMNGNVNNQHASGSAGARFKPAD